MHISAICKNPISGKSEKINATFNTERFSKDIIDKLINKS